MKPFIWLFFCFLLVPAEAFSADRSTYDGTWDTVLSCSNTGGALGYSFRFPSIIKDNALHAQKGTKGQPGWLEINGKILVDGSTSLYAEGLVGASEVAVGHRPPGTAYGYHIDARFTAQEGSGKRVEGRPCQIVFTRAK